MSTVAEPSYRKRIGYQAGLLGGFATLAAALLILGNNSTYEAIAERQAEIIIPDEWPRALGYEPWVEEVWANYISNALKYGGHPLRVELGADVEPDGMVRFWVRDNGDGIAEEERARLFTPFTRLDKNSDRKGHGLGLSIVKRIVEKLGGRVVVESEAGQGSTFSFTLPSADRQEV